MVKYCIAVHLPCTAEEYMVLKDDPAYVNFQLAAVGAREVSREITGPDAAGYCTQTILNRPNVSVPRLLRPLLRGKQVEFRDVRRWVAGSHTTTPFSVSLQVSNNISDRVTQRATITVGNVFVDEFGEVETSVNDETTSTTSSDKTTEEKQVTDPAMHSPERIAHRVRVGATGHETCQIICAGEVTVRAGPLSRAAENLTIKQMRAAYGRFPEIVEAWKKEIRDGGVVVTDVITNGNTSNGTAVPEGTRTAGKRSGNRDGDGDCVARLTSPSSSDSCASGDEKPSSDHDHHHHHLFLRTVKRLRLPNLARRGVVLVKGVVATQWQRVDLFGRNAARRVFGDSKPLALPEAPARAAAEE
mgnify:FL=1|jgi:phage baseplate assembly protein gpV|tara:strand:- start:4732 stop:5805 length:1074 start_codon:yes stop_codon:yes gene_type:complete|mmetsp:Transcript_8403/g.28055  ORF Transcript_8403/g.28055 Transcript_8403/m.28055 type:complete len:358 (+) Transcript_8403:256-1329(+)|eukprot:CAMPEP_0119219602 /NCGR_PEP_ID=MMETSP1327-20130426/23859_1 /TAXON_ID=38833 /ORGANISM="Micromonas pusilla, Strain RCC2306" /LENGTH=357 /DNA_ID=CAMNT_0007217677 /DNA_START=204 /DNA_END=1277 /DNA_ORIENTATION=+